MSTKPDPKWKPTFEMIGWRIRCVRELIYPTQNDFAKALDVDKSTVTKIENGQRGMTLITLIYAGNKLRTGADFLLYGDLRNVHPVLVEKLLKRHPEMAQRPGLPAKPKRPVFEPDWHQILEEEEAAPPTPIDTGTETRPRPRSRRASRSNPQ